MTPAYSLTRPKKVLARPSDSYTGGAKCVREGWGVEQVQWVGPGPQQEVQLGGEGAGGLQRQRHTDDRQLYQRGDPYSNKGGGGSVCENNWNNNEEGRVTHFRRCF